LFTTKPKAFTLFEFIVVVTIAAIVVGVMMINSQYFLTHVRVMKVKEEHAMLKRALENYGLDYASYPSTAQSLDALDSPTAYVARLPSDPFNQTSSTASYAYFYHPGGGYEWMLVSPGPNGELEFSVSQVETILP